MNRTLQSGQPVRAPSMQQATLKAALENRGAAAQAAARSRILGALADRIAASVIASRTCDCYEGRAAARHEWLRDAGLSIMYAYFRRSYGPGPFDDEGGVPTREWRLKRNCSLTPRQSLAATVFLMALVLAIGVAAAFASGVWLALPFSMLCTVAVGIAFIAYARHATDGEVLTFAPPFVIVEIHECGCRTMHRMNAARLSVSLGDSDGAVYLCDGWQRIPVGRQLPAAARAEFVRQLRRFIVDDC
ncbi:UNVERIFIED_ORG: putative membrane protein [Burkholderia sp. CF145]